MQHLRWKPSLSIVAATEVEASPTAEKGNMAAPEVYRVARTK